MVRLFNRYISKKAIGVGILDTLMIGAGFLAAVIVRFWSDPHLWRHATSNEALVQGALFVAVVQICFYGRDLYAGGMNNGAFDQLARITKAMAVSFVLLAVTFYSVRSMQMGRGVLLIALVATLGLVLLSRCGLETLWPHTNPRQTLLIVGTGRLAQRVETEFRARAHLTVYIAGPFDPQPRFLASEDRSLLSTVDARRVSHVVVATEGGYSDALMNQLARVKVKGVAVEDAHSALAALTGHWWLDVVQPASFVFSNGFRVSKTEMMAKRMVDVAMGTLGLVLCLPLMIVIAVAIKCDSKGPVLYRQRRLGLRGHQFEVLKFRSMIEGAEGSQGPQWATVRDPRITRCGALLRKYRLDELPQLINIIVGNMSVVGPRPERPEFVALLRQSIRYYDERHAIRPGLTGWAQVKYPYGSSVLDAKRKLEYDLFYIERRSLAFDFVILLKTVKIVLNGGVPVFSASSNAGPEATRSLVHAASAGAVRDGFVSS